MDAPHDPNDTEPTFRRRPAEPPRHVHDRQHHHDPRHAGTPRLDPDARMKQEIHRILDRLHESAGEHRRRASEAVAVARQLTALLESLMDNATTLAAKLTELGTKQSSYEARQDVLVAALEAHVKALEDENTANPNVDLQPLIDQAQSIIDAIPAEVPPTIEGSADATGSGGSKESGGGFVDPATDPRGPAHLR